MKDSELPAGTKWGEPSLPIKGPSTTSWPNGL